MQTSDFDYDLPPELIAQQPLPQRSDSRMLVVRRDSGTFEHRHVSDLTAYLHAGDLLVVNNTKVIPARIFGHRSATRGRVELLLLEETGDGVWDCLCRASRRPRLGDRLVLAGEKIEAEVLPGREEGKISVRLSSARPLGEVLDEEGFAPVPPYIRREREPSALSRLDKERYQTVYASQPGAVAAPTAGLHFTGDLLRELADGGVRRTEVTLHVGPGTFLPVKSERVEDHRMQAEHFSVSGKAASMIRAVRRGTGRVVAVGSTTVRTLETVAAERDDILACRGSSSLFIYPPYDFRAVDVMLTNFHLPRSTLLMMVSAFACPPSRRGSRRAGQDLILQAYSEAVRWRYRFYSYGDCMLIV